MATFLLNGQRKSVTYTGKIQPTFVEFVGAAGIGKSFLADKVRAKLMQRGIPVGDIKRMKIKKHSIRNWLTIAESVFIALTFKPKSTSVCVRSVKRLARYRIRRRFVEPHNCVYISDEGIFQMLRTLTRNSASLCMTDIVDRLIKYVDTPDIVIVFYATPETIFLRRSRRNRQNETFSRDTIANDVLLLDETIRTIKHVQVNSKENLRMVLVDANEDDSSATIQRTAGFIETALAHEQ